MNQYNALLTVKDLAIAYGNIKAVKASALKYLKARLSLSSVPMVLASPPPCAPSPG